MSLLGWSHYAECSADKEAYVVGDRTKSLICIGKGKLNILILKMTQICYYKIFAGVHLLLWLTISFISTRKFLVKVCYSYTHIVFKAPFFLNGFVITIKYGNGKAIINLLLITFFDNLLKNKGAKNPSFSLIFLRLTLCV